MNDSGSHLIDIILWMTGLQPQEVFGYIDNVDTPVDINSALSVKFKNGAEASVAIVAESPTFFEDVAIWGTKGVLQFYFLSGKVLHQKGEMNKPPEEATLPRATSNPDANFVNVILGKEKNESTSIGGLRVIELTEAAWESGRTGKPVKVK